MLRIRSLTVLASLALLAPMGVSQADQPLPPPQFPDENPMLPDQDILGKFLFWEEQVSHDNTMSCGTCHIHETGGSDPRSNIVTHPGPDGIFGNDDDVHGSPGVINSDFGSNSLVHDSVFGSSILSTGRKSPSAINAWTFIGPGLFWDGRAPDQFVDPQSGLMEIGYVGALESQAAGPPVSAVEMSSEGRTWDDICDKIENAVPGALMTDLPLEMQDFLSENPTYPDMFEAVYGDSAITSKRIIFAIANYERTLVSNETLVDDFAGGLIAQMPTRELQNGFLIFQGNGNCATCHTLPFTTDQDFHNIGVRPDMEDIGREAVTRNAADRAKFKTPHLRNAALRGHLMHNGRFATVADVVEFYDRGGDFNEGNLDPNILVLNLTEQEKADLTAFIEVAMTDARVANGVFPFTRPTLHSELPSLNTFYGVASQDGLGDFAKFIAHIPANIGNGAFLLGIDDVAANAPVELAFAFAPDLAGTPFPDPRIPVPVNLNLGTIFLRVVDQADGNGLASFHLPLPYNPLLQGMKIYAQWFVADPTALATGGIYGTQGVEIELF